MTHAVTLPVFDGPLELLIELIRKNRIEVTAVSISRITRAYLEQARTRTQASADEAGDFLQLGARLLHIKSLALLPGVQDRDEQAVELGRLNAELVDYERFRTVAAELAHRQASPSWSRGTQSQLDVGELPAPDITLDTLAAAFTRALKVAPPSPPKPAVIQRIVSQAEMATRLVRKLAHGPFELQVVLDEAGDRYEVVVLFAAMLELIKNHVIRVAQDGQFAPITVEAARA